jgi:RimJ/RimL family protein N-acetyltransferase
LIPSDAMLDRQPILEGLMLRLRPLCRDDWDALFAVASDPLIWEQHPAHDRWQEPVFRCFFEEGLAGGGALVIQERATGRVIGSSRYDHQRALPGEVEIGWTFLARDHWGGATNAELKRLMIDHALRAQEAVIFLVGETNLRSRRALEKIGARLTDRIDEAEMAGQPVRHLVYRISRADWAQAAG